MSAMVVVDELELGARAAPPPRARGPRPVGDRASTWGAVGGLLVLIGVVATPGPIEPPLTDGLEWNVLDLDLTTEPDVLWEIENPGVSMVLGRIGETIVFSAGDQVLGEPPPPTVGIDATNGDEQWRFEGGPCVLTTSTATCVTEPATPGAGVVLVDAEGPAAPPLRHPGAMVAMALEDGGMLVIEGGRTALSELLRLDAWGREVWRTRLDFSGLAPSGYWRLGLVGSRVVTSSSTVDLASGEPLDTWAGIELSDDGTARESLDDGSMLLTLTDGTQRVLDPDVLWLDIDDAVDGPVSLRWDDGDVVATWEDGSSRIALDVEEDCRPTARLQGTLVVQCLSQGPPGETQFLGFDQQTGAPLWQRTGLPWSQQPIASADTFVVSTTEGIEGVDPRTGEPRWSVPIEAAWIFSSAVHDYLVIRTPDVLMRLG